jgi:hypothetical protein
VNNTLSNEAGKIRDNKVYLIPLGQVHHGLYNQAHDALWSMLIVCQLPILHKHFRLPDAVKQFTIKEFILRMEHALQIQGIGGKAPINGVYFFGRPIRYLISSGRRVAASEAGNACNS